MVNTILYSQKMIFLLNSLPSAIYSQIGHSIFGASILFCVPIYFSPLEQSTIFLFISLGALSRLADMGFLNLVIIFSSKSIRTHHEYSISSLKYYTFKQHLRKLFIYFPLIFISGCLVLVINNDSSSIFFEWFLYVLALSFTFSINYFLSFHEGAFDISFAHITRGVYFSLSGILFFIFCYLDLSIISLGMSLVLSGALTFIFLLYRGTLDLTISSDLTSLSLHNEFSSLSRKTFFSWLGGYIGTHGLITTSYLFVNPIFSGFLGLTFNIFIFIQNLANVFLVSKIPEISKFASNNFQVSLNLMLANLKKSLILYFFLLTVFLVFFFILPNEYAQRLLGFENIFFIVIAFIGSIATYGFSIFVRAFKVEPFGVMSITTALIAVASMTVIARFSLDHALAGFALASCVSFIWTYLIFLKHKKSYA